MLRLLFDANNVAVPFRERRFQEVARVLRGNDRKPKSQVLPRGVARTAPVEEFAPLREHLRAETVDLHLPIIERVEYPANE